MPAVHRANDRRSEGSATIVVAQQTVLAAGQLIAVENDLDDHGGGSLISKSPGTVLIGGLKVIVANLDDSFPDSLCGVPGAPPEHCHPHPVSGLETVAIYG